MTLREWFYQLFHFRSIILRLQAELVAQDEAITTLSHALVHATTPAAVVVEEVEEKKPLRRVFAKQSYTQMQRDYENQHNWRIREAIAATQKLQERQQGK